MSFPQHGGEAFWLTLEGTGLLGLALQALPSMTLRVPGESRKHLRSRRRGRKAPQPAPKVEIPIQQACGHQLSVPPPAHY